MRAQQFLAPRVLIQDAETGGFLRLIRGWTEDPDAAHDFQTTANALEFCRIGRLAGVQLVLHCRERQNQMIVVEQGLMVPPVADESAAPSVVAA